MTTQNVQSHSSICFVIPREVFSMHRKLSAPNQPTSHSYVLSVFLLILGRDAMNTIAVEEVSAKCVFEGLSFLICWSVEEAASYLNTIKVCLYCPREK